MTADRRETDKLLEKLNLLSALNAEAHAIAQELVEEALAKIAEHSEGDSNDE